MSRFHLYGIHLLSKEKPQSLVTLIEFDEQMCECEEPFDKKMHLAKLIHMHWGKKKSLSHRILIQIVSVCGSSRNMVGWYSQVIETSLGGSDGKMIVTNLKWTLPMQFRIFIAVIFDSIQMGDSLSAE